MKFTNSFAAFPAAVLLCGAAGAVIAVSGGSTPVGAQPVAIAASAPAAADGCAKLAGLKLKDVEIVIATSQSAGAPVQSSGLASMTGIPASGTVANKLPAFCRVVGRIRPEPGSEIGFEVWMPSATWDGRLYGVGMGGFAGSIDYMTLGSALKAGQAAVATDTGHSGTMMESAWAKGRPERVRDYGWRAIHLSTVAAKQVVRAFYGRRPDKSYFVGCSGGGRQGLMEAARFPEDYDGVLSGAPAANFTTLTMALTNPIQAQLAPGAAIRPEQAKLIQDEVIKQCDALDGQADGLVDDPRQCKFDVSKLACGASNSPQCFSPPQIAALNRIYAGPRDASGRQLAGAYLPSGSEAGTPSPILGWEGYILKGSKGRQGGEILIDGFLTDLIQKPFATAATFDFNKDPARLKAALKGIDASPDLGRFFKRGGKLILWHGWADAAIPPEATLQYYDAMLSKSGPRAKDSSQLFMVPGVQHCMGGTGPGAFGQSNPPQTGETHENNMVAALQAWVEKDKRPETIVGRRGFGGMMGMSAPKSEQERLLCAWPAKAVLRPGGDPDKASSYSCTSVR